MESQISRSKGSRAEPWIALALCCRGAVGLGYGTSHSQPARLRRGLLSGLAPPRRRRARRGGNHAIEWPHPVDASTTRADLERPSADGVGSQWTAARPASHRGPHPTRGSTGRGWQPGRWLSLLPACSRISPCRVRPTPHPPAKSGPRTQLAGTVTPRSRSLCLIRF